MADQELELSDTERVTWLARLREWAEQKPEYERNSPKLAAGRQSYSPLQIVEEAEKGTPLGLQLLTSFIRSHERQDE